MQTLFALLEALMCNCESTKLRNSKLLKTLPVPSYKVRKRSRGVKLKSWVLKGALVYMAAAPEDLLGNLLGP